MITSFVCVRIITIFKTPIAQLASIHRLVETEAKANTVDDTVAALNINGVVRERSERALSDDGVVDEVLPHGVTVSQGSVEALEVGGPDGRGVELARDDVHLDDVGGDRSPESLVRLEGRVGGGEDGEGSGSRDLGGDAGGLEGVVELAEVVVSLQVHLLLALGDAEVSPDLSGSLEVLEGGEDVTSSSSTSGSRGGGGRGYKTSRAERRSSRIQTIALIMLVHRV